MTQQTYKTAIQRYKRSFVPLVLIYTALCFIIPLILPVSGVDKTPVTVSLALLNALPIILIMWLILRLSGETDEYSRLRLLQAIAEGTALTIGLSALIGFLELYQIIEPQWTFWVVPVFFLAYGLAFLRQKLSGKTS